MRLSRQKRNQRSRLGASALLLFESLSNCPLPAIVDRIDSIDALRSLISAGFVEAQVPEPLRLKGRIEQPPAVVTGLSKAGHRWASTLKRNNRTTKRNGMQPERNDPATPPRTDCGEGADLLSPPRQFLLTDPLGDEP